MPLGRRARVGVGASAPRSAAPSQVSCGAGTLAREGRKFQTVAIPNSSRILPRIWQQRTPSLRQNKVGFYFLAQAEPHEPIDLCVKLALIGGLNGRDRSANRLRVSFLKGYQDVSLERRTLESSRHRSDIR